MRTTLNIDLHIHRELREYAAEKGISLGEAATYLLGAALKREAEGLKDEKPFEWVAWNLGEPLVDMSDWSKFKEFMYAEDDARIFRDSSMDSAGESEQRPA